MALTRDLENFIATMPPRYGQTFQVAAIEQHARTSRARGVRSVNLGLFEATGRKETALCVVAPDRPGLLAITTLTFVKCGLDIIAAEVFTRRVAEASDEAVDLFWVRRQHPRDAIPLKPSDIRKIRNTLIEMIKRAPSEILPGASLNSKTPAATGTLVRFLEDAEGRFAVLELESADKTGLMFEVCQALFSEAIQIVGSHISTRNGRVQGRFEITEHTELPIEASRRHLIKLAILSAIDGTSKDAISLMAG
jgi:[protein-PII] uridylyltransferase